MQKCYAVYRIESFEYNDVRLGVGRISFPGGFGEFACDLGNLTDSQLAELKIRVGGEVEIPVSDNWNIDQYGRSIILLVKDSNLDDAIRIDLGRMKKHYEQAMEDCGLVAKRLIPLKHCVSIAENIRESQLTVNCKMDQQTISFEIAGEEVIAPVIQELKEIKEAIQEGTTSRENAVFRGMFRATARFREPEDETEDEKVERLINDGWKWKEAVREVFETEDKILAGETLDLKVDEVRQRIKRDRKGRI